MVLFFLLPSSLCPSPSSIHPQPIIRPLQMDQRPRTCFKATGQKKNLLLVGTIPANCPPLRNCTAWRACLGPLNRFWPFVCWELRKIPNSQLSSGHGPNDRRSSSARRKRLEGLCAGPSNHGAPLPTAHLVVWRTPSHVSSRSAIGSQPCNCDRTASNPAIPPPPGLFRASSAS